LSNDLNIFLFNNLKSDVFFSFEKEVFLNVLFLFSCSFFIDSLFSLSLSVLISFSIVV